jgi:long-subunit fatty acid transport protein
MRRTGLVIGIALLALGTLAPGSLSAQVLDESYSGVQLYLLMPGARAMGMGGAFLGLADDATAAYLNPAGLTALEGHNVEGEARQVNYHHQYASHGHYAGEATGRGIDTIDGVTLGDASDSVNMMPYLSYVYAGNGWAVGAYRHQLMQFQARFSTLGLFHGEFDPDPDRSDIERLFPTTNSLDLEVANYGLSFAIDLAESVTIGLGASYYEMEYDALSSRYYFYNDPTQAPGVGRDAPAGTFWGEPVFGPGNVFSNHTQRGEDTAMGFNVGVLWRVSDMVSLGAAYRQGPEFDFAMVGQCIPRDDPDPVDPPCNDFATAGTYRLPTVYGIGAAVRPTDRWTITVDYDRVQYSQLVDEVIGNPEQAGEFDNMRITDSDEFHLGFQYRVDSIANPISIRFGAWFDPAHQAGYIGQDRTLRAMFSAAEQIEDEVHTTVGIGWEIQQRIRVDLGVDISDRVDMVALSAGYRF